MKLRIMIIDGEDGCTMLDDFVVEPGPRDRDVISKYQFANFIRDYLSMRYEMPEEGLDE